MRLDYLTRAFAGAAQTVLSRGNTRLTGAAAKLDALSPLKVLSRGYSIVYKDDQVVKQPLDVSVGDMLRIRLSDGALRCRVVERDVEDPGQRKSSD